MFSLLSALLLPACNGFTVPSISEHRRSTATALAAYDTSAENLVTRRGVFYLASVVAGTAVLAPQSASAVDQGGLDDLPPEAARTYLQYRMPLQISADYYIWGLQDKVKDVNDWGEIGDLFTARTARGGGQPSRIERDFVNPMRVLGLSMPPDIADKLRESQFRFEKAMATITKATAGVRRDLPVEIDKNTEKLAQTGWDEGRLALNEFFDTLNEATGRSEMKTIPSSGPNQTKEYGRSQRRYLELMKVTKLCQNRGGPTLSAAWGQLMVTGTVQDSCGIAGALEDYFYQ